MAVDEVDIFLTIHHSKAFPHHTTLITGTINVPDFQGAVHQLVASSLDNLYSIYALVLTNPTFTPPASPSEPLTLSLTFPSQVEPIVITRSADLSHQQSPFGHHDRYGCYRDLKLFSGAVSSAVQTAGHEKYGTNLSAFLHSVRQHGSLPTLSALLMNADPEVWSLHCGVGSTTTISNNTSSNAWISPTRHCGVGRWGSLCQYGIKPLPAAEQHSEVDFFGQATPLMERGDSIEYDIILPQNQMSNSHTFMGCRIYLHHIDVEGVAQDDAVFIVDECDDLFFHTETRQLTIPHIIPDYNATIDGTSEPNVSRYTLHMISHGVVMDLGMLRISTPPPATPVDIRDVFTSYFAPCAALYALADDSTNVLCKNILTREDDIPNVHICHTSNTKCF